MDISSAVGLITLLLCSIFGVASVLVLSIGSICLNALVIVPPIILAGVSLTVTTASFGVFSIIVIFRSRLDFIINTIFDIRKFGFLTAYTAWALISTLFLPDIFQGKILIYPLSAENGIYVLTPLRHSTSNVTQSMYVLLSYVISVTIYLICSEKNFTKVYKAGIYFLCFGVFITGSMDILGYNDILSLLRNANYSLAADSEIASVKRIVGATPEASSFGFITSSLFSVLLLMPKFFGQNWVWILSLLMTLVFSILSASSTAYGMIITAGMVFIFLQIVTILTLDFRYSMRSITNISYLLGAACIITILLNIYPSLNNQVMGLLNQLIFGKSSSSSYEERSRWTTAAIESIYSSNFMGIGMGSARTSNGIANIASGVGVIGMLFFVLFILNVFISRLGFNAAMRGVGPQLAIIPIFTGFFLSGTTPDYGTFAATLLGLQIGINSNLVRTP